jgi:hypothetical protein
MAHRALLGLGAPDDAEVVEAECQAIDHVQIRKSEAVELIGGERELLPTVRRPHVVVGPLGERCTPSR